MNDPEKWTEQMWVVPGEVRLIREGDLWFLRFDWGQRIKLWRAEGTSLWPVIDRIQRSETRRYRRSLAFRWHRFWYIRRVKKQARIEEGSRG